MTEPVRVVTITAAELEQLLEAVVRRALEGQRSEWLDTDQAAELLGIKRGSVGVLVRRDGLPAHRVGRGYRFKRSEIDAWLVERASRPGGHSARHGATLHVLRGGKRRGDLP